MREREVKRNQVWRHRQRGRQVRVLSVNTWGIALRHLDTEAPDSVCSRYVFYRNYEYRPPDPGMR